MLAPGDYLIQPPDEGRAGRTAPPQPPAGRPQESTQPPAPTAGAEVDEPPSFLLTLLRALGAIHT